MKLRSLAAGGVAMSLLVLAGLGACGVGSGAGGDHPRYQSVDDLFRAAGMVVRIRITDPPETRKIQIGPGSAMDYRVYRARVEKVYKGPPGTATIEVKQLAGGDGGGPALAAGTTYVLFLETYSDVPASLLNPTQAQYAVDPDGRLVAVDGNPLSLTTAHLDRLSTGAHGSWQVVAAMATTINHDRECSARKATQTMIR